MKRPLVSDVLRSVAQNKTTILLLKIINIFFLLSSFLTDSEEISI